MMMEKPFLVYLRLAGLGVGLSLLFYLSGIFVLLTPLPLLYTSVRAGRSIGMVAAVVASLLLAFLYQVNIPLHGEPLLSLPAVIFLKFFSRHLVQYFVMCHYAFFVLIALMLAEGVHRRWELNRWVGSTLVAVLVFCLLAFLIAAISAGTAFFSGLQAFLESVVSEVVHMNQLSEASSAQMEFITTHQPEVATFVARILPAALFLFSLLAVVVNALLGRRLIRTRHALRHIHNVARFRLPDALVWTLIIAGVSFFVEAYLFPSSWLQSIALNSLLIVGSLYFLQGLAVVVYVLQGIRFPLFRSLGYICLFLFFNVVGILIVGLGISDVWVNFRERAWKARHTPS